MADIAWADFTVLATSLTLSIATGIYHAMRSRSLLQDKRLKSAKDEYLMGSRQMPLVPVALSLLTTFNSGILMLGAPAEIFQRGSNFFK
jgi:sodium-coupled monocarboxylate transporter 8/12